MRTGQRDVWLAVGLAALVAVIGVLTRPVIPVDETRYLTVAWEMRLSHDWLVPHLNGAAYSHKPPMLLWLINLAWSLFGESSLVARLVPAAFLPLTVGLAGALSARVNGEDSGGVAALIAMSFVVFSVMSSLVMFDAMLSAACLAALIGLVVATQGRPVRGFALAGAMIGAGLLIKGPAALIPVLPAAVLAPLWVDRPTRWSRYYLGLAAALIMGFGLALAWALPAARAGGPEFRQAILWGQTAGRMVKAFDHARPIWFFAAAAPALVLPWTVSRNLWSAGRGAEPLPRLARLPWIAAAGVFVLFSLVSGKQVHYLAPAMPCLAAGIAGLLGRREAPLSEPGFALVVALFGLAMIAPPLLDTRLAPAAFGAGGLVMVAASLGVWSLRHDASLAAAASCAAIVGGLSLTALLGGLATETAGWVVPYLTTGRPIAFVGDYAGEFGYAARLSRPVAVIDPSAAGSWIAAHPGGVLVYPYRNRPMLDVRPVESHPYKKGMLGVWATAPLAESADAPASR